MRVVGLVCLLLAAQVAWGAQSYLYAARAQVLYCNGPVVLYRAGQKQSLRPSSFVHEGDKIVTGSTGRCLLRLSGGSKFYIGPKSSVALWVLFHSPDGTLAGNPFRFFTHRPKKGIDFDIETPNTLACSKG